MFLTFLSLSRRCLDWSQIAWLLSVVYSPMLLLFWNKHSDKSLKSDSFRVIILSRFSLFFAFRMLHNYTLNQSHMLNQNHSFNQIPWKTWYVLTWAQVACCSTMCVGECNIWFTFPNYSSSCTFSFHSRTVCALWGGISCHSVRFFRPMKNWWGFVIVD